MKYVQLFENYKSGIEKFNSTRAKKEWGQLKNKTFVAKNTSWDLNLIPGSFLLHQKRGKIFISNLNVLIEKKSI